LFVCVTGVVVFEAYIEGSAV